MQLSLRMGIKDERFPKLVGLLSLFLSLYLFIAFTSYLFTWKLDWDKAHWKLLLNTGDYEIHNWLGRLGAVISHQAFYWTFGFSSYIFVFLLFVIGLNRIVKAPFSELFPTFRRSFSLMLWTSFLLAFFFQSEAITQFPWGGIFGSTLVSVIQSLVGTIGTLVILIFIALAAFVWAKNPDFNTWTMQRILQTLHPYSVMESVKTFFAKRPLIFRPKNQPQTQENTDVQGTSTALVPINNTVKTVRPIDRTDDPDEAVIEAETDNGAKIPEKTTREELENRIKHITNNQLKLNLTGKDKDGGEPVDDSSKPIDLNTNVKTPKTSNNSAKSPDELQVEITDDVQDVHMFITEENQEHIEPYDPTLELPRFENPVLDLLESYDDQKPVIDRAELETNKDQIIATLLNYKIEIVKIKATIGPTVTLYEIVPAPGIRISKIKSLEDDIALSLSALGIRIIAPMPGKGTIGIEVPNRNKQVVSLKEVLASPKFKAAKMDLPIALGKSISNEVFVADLAKMPHLLIAGATGQGKSVGINTIIVSLLYKKHPSQLKLILIDPKKVELSPYNKIANHYLGFLPGEEEAIVTDTSKVVQTLHSLTVEMDSRYNLLKKANVRNINEYNQKFVQRRLNPENGHHFLPYIVLVVDEFADMIMTAGKEVEMPIGRLAQLARAVGIHLIIATQRPSVNIITGVIKANFPARLAFKVASKVDSRTILDGGGADQLIGRGDMLLSMGSDVIRLQCAFVDTPEVERVIDFITEQPGYPEPFLLPAFTEDGEEEVKLKQVLMELDEFFEDSARLIVINQQGSTSMIQRRLKLGYNRAGRIMDQLEHTGIVGSQDGSKPRKVLIQDEVELEEHLKALREQRKKMIGGG